MRTSAVPPRSCSSSAPTRPQPLPQVLSDWDVQFLRALYATEQTSLTQRNQIIQMMMRDLPQ